MTEMELNENQRSILAILVDEYPSVESPLTGEAIAEELDISAGTVRNEMQSLTARNLVEGIPGAGGGYKPTAPAYEVMDREGIDDPETVTLAREFERVDTTVDEIDLVEVYDPDRCRARLHFQQSVAGIQVGDAIAVGPTPVSNLLIAGEVEAVDEAANEVTLDIARLETTDRDEN